MHTRISRAEKESSIGLDEWKLATSSIEGFVVNDICIQQNPFTLEFLGMESSGSGYWVPSSNDAPDWPGSGKVVFRKDEQGITFVQYQNENNPVLVSLAKQLDAEVYAYEI